MEIIEPTYLFQMEEMARFISRTYKDQDEPDIDDLLDGLGISLN